MVRIELSSHYQCKSRTGQMFTVYCLQVYWNGGQNSVEKRYRDFYRLNCQLKKYFRTIPEFPPKSFRKLDPNVIEYRVKSLERYLQSIILNDDWPSELIDFLQVPNEAVAQAKSNAQQITAYETNDDEDDECVLSHAPLIGFTSSSQIQTVPGGLDPERNERSRSSFVEEGDSTEGQECHSRDSFSSLTDIVMTASLEAFYSLDIH